jgi:hypothetical protein
MIRAGTRVAAPPQRGTTRIGALGEGRPPIGIGSTDRPRLLLRGELGGPSIRRLDIPWLFRLRDKPYNWPLSTFRCTPSSLTALRARRSCIGNCLVDAASFFLKRAHPSDVATGPIAARDEDELGDVSLLHCISPVLCRFSAAGSDDLTMRSVDRRLKSAKARNRVGR